MKDILGLFFIAAAIIGGLTVRLNNEIATMFLLTGVILVFMPDSNSRK